MRTAGRDETPCGRAHNLGGGWAPDFRADVLCNADLRYLFTCAHVIVIARRDTGEVPFRLWPGSHVGTGIGHSSQPRVQEEQAESRNREQQQQRQHTAEQWPALPCTVAPYERGPPSPAPRAARPLRRPAVTARTVACRRRGREGGGGGRCGGRRSRALQCSRCHRRPV